VFARQGTVGLHGRPRTAPEAGIAWFTMLPHVMPLLAQRPARVPHLRITAGLARGVKILDEQDPAAADVIDTIMENIAA
jgi:hypothetical protein